MTIKNWSWQASKQVIANIFLPIEIEQFFDAGKEFLDGLKFFSTSEH